MVRGSLGNVSIIRLKAPSKDPTASCVIWKVTAHSCSFSWTDRAPFSGFVSSSWDDVYLEQLLNGKSFSESLSKSLQTMCTETGLSISSGTRTFIDELDSFGDDEIGNWERADNIPKSLLTDELELKDLYHHYLAIRERTMKRSVLFVCFVTSKMCLPLTY